MVIWYDISNYLAEIHPRTHSYSYLYSYLSIVWRDEREIHFPSFLDKETWEREKQKEVSFLIIRLVHTDTHYKTCYCSLGWINRCKSTILPPEKQGENPHSSFYTLSNQGSSDQLPRPVCPRTISTLLGLLGKKQPLEAFGVGTNPTAPLGLPLAMLDYA